MLQMRTSSIGLGLGGSSGESLLLLTIIAQSMPHLFGENKSKCYIIFTAFIKMTNIE